MSVPNRAPIPSEADRPKWWSILTYVIFIGVLVLTVIGLKEGMGALVGGLIGDKEGQSTARLAREVESVRLVALEVVRLHGEDPHGDLDTVFRQEAHAWLQANSPTA
ncbi:MAG: hypothetical protein Q8P50_04460, partial [Bacillota bacterium]|nr:hypothetical protein [Bacillota bacterium]